MFIVFFTFSSKIDAIPTFVLDGVIDPNWGELVAVFDQKNSQRLTFENNEFDYISFNTFNLE